MTTQPSFTRAMLGYALWVATEDGIRNWLSRRLIDLYGVEWANQIPTGIWNTLQERYNEKIKPSNFSQVRELIEHSDFPDLFNIVKYKKQAKLFLPERTTEDVDYYAEKLYSLRNQIAHKPHGFNVRSLDELISCVEWVADAIGPDGKNLLSVKEGIESRPEAYALQIPEEFVQSAKSSTKYKISNNLPPMDYEFDGGFVGRRDELKELKRRLLDKRIHPIITVSGAGGVGKTALAHRVCEDILINHSQDFSGVIWISAKKDRLTLTGIEEIEPTAQSFEEVLDAVLNTFGLSEYVNQEIIEKRKLVQEIVFDDVSDPRSGILLVIDNLETILHDETLIEYIKDIPLPHKVLITSRIGLGEIERRIPLKGLTSGDAVELFRIVAIEKSAKGLAQLATETIKTYVQRMSAYPLVIKWVVGLAALNQDIERLVQSINSTDSDISKFCFEFIYDHMLSENAKLVLRCLAASEHELTQAALMHVAELNSQTFEDVMMELERASLVIPNTQSEDGQNRITTRYGILPLTKGYLISRAESGKDIKARLKSVQNLIEDARRAKKQYELSLEFLGAETEEELIASKHVQTAFTRNQAQDYEGALDALKRAVEIAPNFAAVYRSWAVIEQNNENFDRAVELYEKAVSLKAGDPITWFHWGNLERKLTNYENARRYLNRALELVQDKTSVLIALGNVEKQDSNFKEAIELFEQAIAIATSDMSRITDRDLIVARTSMADTYYRWAEAYERDAQLNAAIERAMLGYETMVKVAELGSYDTKTRETQMKIMLLIGRLYKKTKNLHKSREFFEKVVDMKPPTWSREQRRYASRACYYLIPFLLDGNDISHASEVYNYGLSSISYDDNFRERYEKLKLLLNDNNRHQGVFTHIVADKGYGFIKCDEVSPDGIFAHISEFVDEVSDRDFSFMREVWVSFSVSYDEKGIAAKTIRILA